MTASASTLLSLLPGVPLAGPAEGASVPAAGQGVGGAAAGTFEGLLAGLTGEAPATGGPAATPRRPAGVQDGEAEPAAADPRDAAEGLLVLMGALAPLAQSAPPAPEDVAETAAPLASPLSSPPPAPADRIAAFDPAAPGLEPVAPRVLADAAPDGTEPAARPASPAEAGTAPRPRPTPDAALRIDAAGPAETRADPVPTIPAVAASLALPAAPGEAQAAAIAAVSRAGESGTGAEPPAGPPAGSPVAAAVPPLAREAAAPSRGPARTSSGTADAARAQRQETAARPAPVARRAEGQGPSDRVAGSDDESEPAQGAGPGREASLDHPLDGPPPAETAVEPAAPAIAGAEARAAREVETPAADGPLVRGAPETVARLAADIVRKLGGQNSRFELQLDPAGLGKVDVSIEIDRDGRLSAALTFESSHAAADLRGRAADLRQALESAGFDLSEGGLTFDLADQGASGRDAGQRRQDQAWTARVFRDVQGGLEAADTALAAAVAALSRRDSLSGVDIRI
ncbi:MAG: flagellar hook-length control protein FliK [Pseudomonadota bacterium]